jgi:hypothetical protein
VVVSVQDLAEKLRKRPEIVATALNLLLREQRVQKAPLNGYWKLNVCLIRVWLKPERDHGLMRKNLAAHNGLISGRMDMLPTEAIERPT